MKLRSSGLAARAIAFSPPPKPKPPCRPPPKGPVAARAVARPWSLPSRPPPSLPPRGPPPCLAWALPSAVPGRLEGTSPYPIPFMARLMKARARAVRAPCSTNCAPRAPRVQLRRLRCVRVPFSRRPCASAAAPPSPPSLPWRSRYVRAAGFPTPVLSLARWTDPNMEAAPFAWFADSACAFFAASLSSSASFLALTAALATSANVRASCSELSLPNSAARRHLEAPAPPVC
mmetsp:Transcript_41420/g.93350  ORF Transcript_41420/g.93350 Transcript_41420/m.93350 type:complete len:232 (-) Transcript_41420:835-1530(-)